MKIVIVGHVDHGKSTLIGRLFYDTDSLPESKIEEIKKTCEALGREIEFGFIMDNLREEREQGITIDTTQAFFKTDKRDYVIIDAPGHKEFIKNMITGASQAESAILIIDADEGVQEQTKRHAYILSMLGLNQVIVVINKMDLVGYKQERFEEVKKNALRFLDSINIKPGYVIPISAKDGDNIAKRSKNIDWYKDKTVLESLDTFKIKLSQENKALRFPVQDVYKIDNKRIIAGRIESGAIKTGDEVVLLPSETKTRVKSIEMFGKGDVKESFAGESTGITTTEPVFVDRGIVICHDKAKVTNTINANVFWMSKRPLDKNENIIFKCATQEVSCKIDKILRRIDSSSLETIEENSDKLENNEVGKVILKTNEDVVIDNFNDIPELGRFVLERGTDICAGGTIVE